MEAENHQASIAFDIISLAFLTLSPPPPTMKKKHRKKLTKVVIYKKNHSWTFFLPSKPSHFIPTKKNASLLRVRAKREKNIVYPQLKLLNRPPPPPHFILIFFLTPKLFQNEKISRDKKVNSKRRPLSRRIGEEKMQSREIFMCVQFAILEKALKVPFNSLVG